MEHQTKLIEYLNSFSKLSIPLVNKLNENLTIRNLKKGDTYITKNTYSKNMGFLGKGIMRIHDIDASGQEWNKVILSTPSLVIGNLNINEKSVHTLDAITPCELIEFPISFLEYALNNYPEAKDIKAKILIHLFEKKAKREYDFLSLNAKERYLKLIQEQSDIIDQLPKLHIARYLGITATQLSRISLSIKNQQM